MRDHLSDDALEEYSLDKLSESRSARIEQHLLCCEYCRARLLGIEPVNSVHFTRDGPVYSRITRLATGDMMARHWGSELDGGRVFRSLSAAKRYLSTSCSQMFPEHECDGRCGPTQNRGLMVVPRTRQNPKAQSQKGADSNKQAQAQ